mmetsp:Transcript_11462/g.17172  ORF Transcript_11462/g.17172 Transcript_11462/m.17172 type:complete len:191 (-) Transcript_11462:2081-2653(-)
MFLLLRQNQIISYSFETTSYSLPFVRRQQYARGGKKAKFLERARLLEGGSVTLDEKSLLDKSSLQESFDPKKDGLDEREARRLVKKENRKKAKQRSAKLIEKEEKKKQLREERLKEKELQKEQALLDHYDGIKAEYEGDTDRFAKQQAKIREEERVAELKNLQQTNVKKRKQSVIVDAILETNEQQPDQE